MLRPGTGLVFHLNLFPKRFVDNVVDLFSLTTPRTDAVLTERTQKVAKLDRFFKASLKEKTSNVSIAENGRC